jgi:hypothetical protein
MRTAKCDRSQAQIRLTHAKKFFEVAELVASEGDAISESLSVAAALAVLAGIAASDAAIPVQHSSGSHGGKIIAKPLL